MPEAPSLAGRLLVAAPALSDPNFTRSVVLMLEHNGGGALGVVLNRPTPVGVADVLGSWAELVGDPGVVFRGGPVALDAALALAIVPGGAEVGGAALGWRRVRGAIGIVDLDAPPELLAAEIGSLRVFAGYAGWSAEQLEGELEDGSWYVVDAEPGDVRAAEPQHLWRAVLRRQRGRLAMLATYPDDPSLN